MQLIKPTCLSLMTRPIGFRKRLGLGISAAIAVPFSNESCQNPLTEMTLARIVAEQLGADGLLHEGVPKTQAEFLVAGTAWPPERPVVNCPVRVSVGTLEKTLLVFGERHWAGDRITDPAPFHSCAIDWTKAFGGALCEANPLGRGHLPSAKAIGSERPLPRIELFGQPIVHRADEPVPAGLGPLDAQWTLRRATRGTYDDSWYREHSPGFAPDTHWSHFNVAPPDQRFASDPKGNEPYRFRNMHPAKPDMRGVLPGFAVRVLVRRDGKLRPIAMRLTTLWFFPHIERAILVFQGLADVQRVDGTDIDLLLAALERVESPMRVERYVELIDRRANPEDGFIESLDESGLMPAGITTIDADFERELAQYRRDDLARAAQARRADFLQQERRTQLASRGVHVPPIPSRVDVPRPGLADMPGLLRAARAQARAATQAMGKEKRVGLPPVPSSGPPVFDFRKAAALEIQRIQAARPVPPAEVDAIVVRMAQVERAGRDGYLKSAHNGTAPLPLPTADSARARAACVDALANRRSLHHVNLTGADLRGLDLRNADFSDANCEGALFDGCQLQGCNFTRAVLAHASLKGADASRAVFIGANLGKANLDGANLSFAVCDEALWMDSHIRGVDLSGASLTQTQLVGSSWERVDARNARLSFQTFHRVDMATVQLAGADLTGATFIECVLDGVVFDACKGTGLTLIECRASRSSWRGAGLQKAVFTKNSRLDGAVFEAADMTRVNLRGCSLLGADLSDASMSGADLSDCEMSRVVAPRLDARDALWIRASLVSARMEGGNLMDSIFMDADLRGADLRWCNLYGADLSRVVVDAATLLEGSATERARLHPRAPIKASA